MDDNSILDCNLSEASILVVEDDQPSRIYLATILKKYSNKVYFAEDGKNGYDSYVENSPDIVLTDIGMPIMNGLDMSRLIKKINPKAQIILTTAFDNKNFLLDAIEIGINQYIIKPIQKTNLITAIERCYKQIQLEKAVQNQYNHIIKLSSAIEQSPNMVVLLDSNFAIEYVNPVFAVSTGFDENEAKGNTLDILNFTIETSIHKIDFNDYCEKSKNQKTTLKYDFLGKKKSKELFWVSCSISPIFSSDNELTNYVLNLEDITQRKLSEQALIRAHDELEKRVIERTTELRESNERLINEIEIRKRTEEELIQEKELAETANKVKGAFLANVSHELRTPLNGIIGISSFLLSSNIDAKQKKFLEMVKVSADNLLAIINDILDFSKIEAGKLQISNYKFNIRNVIEQVIGLNKQNAKLKKLQLASNINSDIPEFVFGDSGRIKQILLNLVSNALKFTEKGEVNLNISSNKRTKSDIQILFAVSDTGIGIPNDKINLLFKSFSQVDGSFTRKYGGTGLGLSISKELVELMGGKIWVESYEGIGSTFYFTVKLKLIELENQTNSIEEKSELDDLKTVAQSYPDIFLRVLVAEDSFINQEVLKQVLFQKNWEIVIVENGLQAIEAIKSDTHFDIVFMDIHMPELDGIEATKEIRKFETEHKKSNVPIIGLTAHSFESNATECFEAGMNSFVSKPFKWNDIYSAVFQALNIERELNNNNTQASETPPANLDTLIISLNNNKAVLKNIINYFLNNYEKTIKNLEIAIKQKDFKQINAIAHKFKSELGNFNAVYAVDAAKNIELISKNETIDFLDDEFKKLKESTIIFANYLKNYDIGI